MTAPLMPWRNHTVSDQNVSRPFRPFGRSDLIVNEGACARSKMSTRYSIAIVDDNEAVRTSMVSLLESAGHEVLSFASGDAFLDADLPVHLDCLLLDMQMPGKNGLDVLRAISEHGDRPSVLVITGHGDIPMAVEAMKLGAFDFLQKPFAASALLAAVESASEYYLYSQARLTGCRDAMALVAKLSLRQRQVLAGILKGRPNKLIAYDLGLSIRTVEAYRAQTLGKLGVHSTAEAVRIAIAAGMGGIALGWDGAGAEGAAPAGDCISARPLSPPQDQCLDALLLD